MSTHKDDVIRTMVVSTTLLLVIPWSGAAAASPPTITETQKITTPFTNEMLGVRLSCRGRRCAAEYPSPGTRNLVWSSLHGWARSGTSSGHFSSVDDRSCAQVLSTTAVGVLAWEPGDDAPDSSTYKYIYTDDSEVLALSDDLLAVSRRPVGIVEVYSRDPDGSWSLYTTFEGPVADRFGHDVDLYEDTVVIGEPAHAYEMGTGHVAIYDGYDVGPPTIQYLTSPDGKAGNTFGHSVAVWGDWLAVGAPFEDTEAPLPVASNVGAVYLYERGSAGFEYRVTLFGEAEGDRHGWDLDLQGDTLVVGAPLADDGGVQDAGLAYVYGSRAGQWSLVARLRASEPPVGSLAGDQLGTSVAVSGPGVLVGAPFTFGTSFASDAGAIYHYQWLGTAVFISDFEPGTTEEWSAQQP